MISVPEFLLTFHGRTPGTPRENVFLDIQGKINHTPPKRSAKAALHKAPRRAWHLPTRSAKTAPHEAPRQGQHQGLLRDSTESPQRPGSQCIRKKTGPHRCHHRLKKSPRKVTTTDRLHWPAVPSRTPGSCWTWGPAFRASPLRMTLLL
ncbi:hypothetical protein U0070_011509, partial [Myodes glareolus]